jgi:hypothetical protein
MTNSYCAKLWNHQYVHTNGSIRLCCATLDNVKDSKGVDMHINDHSLQNAWNSKGIKDLRLKMIKGESIPSCVKCVKQESRGFQSMRELQDREKNYALTKSDGAVDVFPSTMELHVGNMCNLKCKMCGQQWSNQVGKEILDIGKKDPAFKEWVIKESGNVNIWTNNLSVEYKWFQNKKTKLKLFDHIAKHITKFSVIGGEPTVIPEFWEMFEYLDDRGVLGRLNVVVNTNLTNVNPKLTKWLPKLKSWRIWGSVDGVGERTEYIRYPSNWKKINENLSFYKNLTGDNGYITLSPAIQLLNIDQLDELLVWWLNFCDGNFGADKKFYLSWMAQVSYPTICNYDILPKEYKIKIANKLKQNQHLFEDYKIISQFYKVQIENLEKDICEHTDRKHFQRAFIRYNDTQDMHRKTKPWREILPDLEQALTESLS